MITETWLSDKHSDAVVNLPGYSIYRHDRPVGRGGGVCIYLEDSIVCNNFNVSVLPIDCPAGIDSLFLLITNVHFTFVLACVYRPPDASVSVDDDRALFYSFSQLFAQYGNVIVAGDFNFPGFVWPVDLTAPTSTRNLPLLDFILNSHVSQIVDEPTRFRCGELPSTLDLIFSSSPDLLANLLYLPPVGKSDHVTLQFELQASFDVLPRKMISARTYINFDSLNNDLSAVNWASVLSSSDVSVNWHHFRTIINDLSSKNSHTKIITSVPSKPWIDSSILALIDRKRGLWQKFRRSNLDADFEAHRRFSNRLSAKIKKARIDYEKKIANSGNLKTFFKYVRASMNCKVGVPQLRSQDGSLTFDADQVASLFASKFFENFTPDPHLPLPSFNILANLNDSITHIDFTPELIATKISKLDNTSSPGPDSISSILLKSCSSSLCVPLSLIMNQSFATSSLPLEWKTALVKPIFKKGDKFDSSNYRPISLTTIASKIMESIISQQILDFLINNSILPKEQHGFIPGRSVETNLLCCISDWIKALDKGRSVDVIYLDFCKAFDKVNIRLLLYKLSRLGIRGALLDWIRNFLSDRTFRVKVGQALSSSFDVISGVPQGSVLGPLLFLLFIIDIPSLLSSPSALYADDIKLYNDAVTHHDVLQTDLNRISEWCELWLLPLNLSKCVVLHLGQNNPNHTYSISGSNLSSVESHIDLGVVITRDLSWSNHIACQVKKANSRAYLIRRAFARADPLTLGKLFKLYVRPFLEYASLVWYPVLQSDRDLLDKVLRRFSRYSFGRSRPSYSNRLTMMHLIDVDSRRRRGDLISTFKALTLTSDGAISHLFSLRGNSRLRGHELTLARPRFISRRGEYLFPSRVCRDWNALPAEVIFAPSVLSFKARLDVFMNW